MEFMISLLLVLLAAWLGGVIAHRIGYPSMLGELLAGMILGPALLGWLPNHEGLKFIAEFGIFIMMLYIGAEIDPRELLKASRNAILAAIGGFVVPFGAGFAVTYWYLQRGGVEERSAVLGGLFVGMAVGVTSLAAKSRILLDLKLLDTRIAVVLMAGALFADTAALVVFAGITGFADEGTVSVLMLSIVCGKALLFFGICTLLGLYVLPIVSRLPPKLGIEGLTATLTVVLLAALTFGEIAHLMGLHNILGAFMAGLFLRRSIPDRQQHRELTKRIHDMAIGLFAPVFFVTAGFEFRFDVFSEAPGLLFAVVAVAIVGKIVGTVLFYLPSGHGWREGLTIGCGMNGRGAVEIIIAGIGLEAGLIDQTLFSILVFMAIFTTALVPVSLKWCVSWLERHDQLVRLSHREGYVIMGAGPLARLLATMLSSKNPVHLLDVNQDHCRMAREAGLPVTQGNALDEGMLVDEVDLINRLGFLALTSNSELNVVGARLAQEQFLVPNTAVALAVGKQSNIANVLERGDLGVLFRSGLDVEEWSRCVAKNKHMTEITVIKDAESAARLAEETELGVVLPLVFQRNDALRPVLAGETFELGDQVTLIREKAKAAVEVDQFDLLVAKAKIFDFPEALDLEAFLGKIAPSLAEELGRSAAEVIAAYREREQSSGTVLGQGVAIPHILLDGMERSHLLIARAKSGIRFSEDEDVVHILFVMASSRDQRNLHLRCLSAIAQIVQSPAFETGWFQAESTEHLRELLLRTKRRRV